MTLLMTGLAIVLGIALIDSARKADVPTTGSMATFCAGVFLIAAGLLIATVLL